MLAARCGFPVQVLAMWGWLPLLLLDQPHTRCQALMALLVNFCLQTAREHFRGLPVAAAVGPQVVAILKFSLTTQARLVVLPT